MTRNDRGNMPDASHPSEIVSQPQSAHWKFWGSLLWGVLIAAAFIVVQAITILAVLINEHGAPSESELVELYVSTAENGYALSIATLITAVVCCGLIVGIVKLKKHSVLKDYLAIRPVSLRTMLQWLGALAALIIVSDVLTVVLGRPIVPDFMSELYATANPAWLLWVALLVGAPLFEETFFRGFLFRGFESSFLATTGTVLLTAGLWALLHLQYDAYGVATVFCLGLLLGVARARTGSLWVPLGLHSTANLVATIEAAVLT